jgi:hypothetical protein
MENEHAVHKQPLQTGRRTDMETRLNKLAAGKHAIGFAFIRNGAAI